MRNVLTIGVASAALALTLAGCGEDPQAGGGGGNGSGSSYAAVIKGLDNPFFQQMEQGIDAQAKDSDANVEVQAAQSITDTSGQADRLNAMAQQGYDCYVVNPISGTNLIQGLAQIAANGTPVVNIDSPVEEDAADKAGLKVSTYIGTDNVEAGKMGGEEMSKALGGQGKVALIGGISGDVTSNARLEGFKEGAGDLDIVQTVAADWDRQTAQTRATDILSANPDLAGFFSANDDMALGIARAVADAGKTGDVAIVGVDGIEDALKAVESGDLTASVAQYPYAIGQMGVQACQMAADGEELPSNVTAPVAVVTKDNAQDALQAFPAPFEKFDNPLS
jgi:ABC-type sugar transport system substrate-binding protein